MSFLSLLEEVSFGIVIARVAGRIFVPGVLSWRWSIFTQLRRQKNYSTRCLSHQLRRLASSCLTVGSSFSLVASSTMLKDGRGTNYRPHN